MKNPFGTRRRGTPSGGEMIDRAAHDSIHLAHQALERFPDVVRRHRFIAGGAAVSGSLIALAGVAIARRMLSGQTAEEAVASVTEEEIQGAVPQELRRKPSVRAVDVDDEAPAAAVLPPDGTAVNGAAGEAGEAAEGTSGGAGGHSANGRAAGAVDPLRRP